MGIFAELTTERWRIVDQFPSIGLIKPDLDLDPQVGERLLPLGELMDRGDDDLRGIVIAARRDQVLNLGFGLGWQLGNRHHGDPPASILASAATKEAVTN